MSLSYGSVCSGIEAASVAWEIFRWRPAWFAEIDAAPAAVLAHRFPKIANLGDMTKIAQYVRLGLVEAPDILVGGTPCQAFSVAGVRAGLTDPRGQLTLAYADLANAIDERRPNDECVIYWENVPGVLSDKTNAFGCFLGLLAGESSELVAPGGKWPNAGCVFGPQRAIAWRVLDAQYFGVAQRRRRVFVVASARAGFDPAKLLFEFDGMRRDIAPSRQTGQEITGTIASRTSGGGGLGTDFDCAGGLQAWPAQIAPTLNAAFGDKLGLENQHINGGAGLFVPAYSVALRGREGGATAELGDNLAGCAQASGGGGDKPHVLTYSIPAPHVDVMPTMLNGANTPAGHNARSGHTKDNYITPVCVTGEITHCLKAEGFDASEDGTGRGQPITAAFNWNAMPDQMNFNEHTTPTLTRSQEPAVGLGMAVRRLTPRECERLQGFPDDWTLVPYGRKMMADSPRYKMCGNSMAVPCMRWLGARLLATHPEFLAAYLKAAA